MGFGVQKEVWGPGLFQGDSQPTPMANSLPVVSFSEVHDTLISSTNIHFILESSASCPKNPSLNYRVVDLALNKSQTLETNI